MTDLRPSHMHPTTKPTLSLAAVLPASGSPPASGAVESGAGKSLFARAKNRSNDLPHRSEPLDMVALREHMLESEYAHGDGGWRELFNG